MATILDAPSALGNYMLKGWVLTNRPCPNTGCRIPLLRSPEAQDPVVHLCVNCDENKNGPQHNTSTSTSSASHITRVSTPATEVSQDTDDLPPFVETEENRQRRERTDQASAEIGRRLLQGWTMLGDECPRDACYYVPLVRPPKTGGDDRELRKECVLCGSVYTTERDWAGRERLVSVSGSLPQTVPPTTSSLTPAQTSVVPSQRESYPQQVAGPAGTSQSFVPTSKTEVPAVANTAPMTVASIIDTLDSSAEALQLSLQNLTSRLTSLASSTTFADPASIATTADAISKVTQALSQVKQLQWSETQARAVS